MGLIKLNVLNPNGSLSCLTLTDISFGRKWDSNFLSAYYLAQQGFRHFQCRSGDFLFFWEMTLNYCLQLGHVGNERLYWAMSNQQLPSVTYSELKQVSFFCAKIKDHIMPYRNWWGKPSEPLHTQHMDSTGRIRGNGLYGSFRYHFALAVTDDATAGK
eukprot:jgi/Phyca11/107978/e_gw1.14.369.1